MQGRSSRAGVLVGVGIGLVLGVLGTVLVSMTLVSDEKNGVEIGEEFESEVKSFNPAGGTGPNVICFEREDSCGFPILTSPNQKLEAGMTVVATEVWRHLPNGDRALAFYVRPVR